MRMNIFINHMKNPLSRHLSPRRFLQRFLGIVILGCLFALVISPAAFSAELETSISPFVGGGTTSSGNIVRNATGLTFGIGIPIELSANPKSALKIGPRFEATNSLVATSYSGGRANTINAVYDHRIFAGGIEAEKSAGALAIYGSLVGGKIFSKLSLDESSKNSFSQTSYSGISGDYLAAESGIKLPVRDSFSLSVGLVAASARLQQNVRGPSDDENVANGTFLTSTSDKNATDSIPVEIVQKTLAAKAGFSVSF